MADARKTPENKRYPRSRLSIYRPLAAVKWLLTDDSYRWIVVPVLAFLITRGFLLIGAYIGRVTFIEIADSLPWQAHPENVFLDIWDRWDSIFYRSIVAEGYVYAPDNPGNVAFFPLYPLLMAAANVVTRDLTVAGILVSNVCFLLALVVLYRLMLLEKGDHAAAERSVYYIALFPTAFFFSAVYTESAFLLFSITCVYFARRRLWLLAGITGALAAATRLVGVLLLAVVIFEWLYAHGWSVRSIWARHSWASLLRRQNNWLGLLFAGLIPLGLIAFMLYLESRFGDPLLFYRAHSSWGRERLVFPFTMVLSQLGTVFQQQFLEGHPGLWRVSADSLVSVLTLLLTIPIARRLGATYAFFTLLSVTIPATSNSVQSTMRFVAVIFPIFMLLALWGRQQRVDRAITIGFAILLAVFSVIFVNWGFIA